MALRIFFLEEFGKAFVPKKTIPHLRSYLLKAGIGEAPYKFFGILFYITAFISLFIYVPFFYPYISERFTNIAVFFLSAFFGWFAIQITLAFFFILLVYFYIDLKIYQRTRKMEELLPEYLQVVSSHLKGGLPFERALWAAIKPRFSVLANEMAEASKKAMTGYEVDKALMEFSEKYNSPTLKRSIELIISELESGGNMARLIDRVVDNLKKTKVLKDEMAASAITYVIFIGAIVIVIAPALFALSLNLLIVIKSFSAKISTSTLGMSSLPLKIQNIAVNPDHFRIFSGFALAIIAVFSSMIVSIVEKGNIKSGLKYIPFFTIGSLAFYFFFVKVLTSIFGNLF